MYHSNLIYAPEYWQSAATCLHDPDKPHGGTTEFGFDMKYKKKHTKIQGNLLMMRHTVDSSCGVAGTCKIKSNALDGLSIAKGTDAGTDIDYGCAALGSMSL